MTRNPKVSVGVYGNTSIVRAHCEKCNDTAWVRDA